MKKNFTYFILFVFTLFSLLGSVAYALDSAPKQVAKKQAEAIATVNIQNAHILSQEGSKFSIYFELTNDRIVQTGVQYGVKLVSKNKDGTQSLIDEKVYEEKLSLGEKSLTKKDIVYEAPRTLSGTYSIVLFASNSSGFPFGISFVKEVTLSPSVKGFEISIPSCYLKVEGEKTNTHYTLLQTVDISKDESLRLNCTGTNHTNEQFSLVPSFETRYQSAYGEIAGQVGGDTMPIKFLPEKAENFSILLPKGVDSKVYNLKVSLKGGNVSSNDVNIRYVIRGQNAIIANASLDRDYYKKGETAVIDAIIMATKTGDKFVRGANTSDGDTLSIVAIITNNHKSLCADESITELGASTGSKISLPIKMTCKDPVVKLSIKDSSGKVLDEKEFAWKTTSIGAPKAPSMKVVIWVILILVAIVVLGWIIKKKKNNMKTILPVLAFLIIGSLTPMDIAKANTFYGGSDNRIQVMVNLDKGNTYHQNDPIFITSEITPSPLGIMDTVKLDVDVGGIFGQIFDVTDISNYPIYYTTRIDGATSSLGSFNAEFVLGVVNDTEPIIIGGGGGGGAESFYVCFIAGTKVAMADGSYKNIEDVKIGDVLKGEKSNNKVIAYHRPLKSDGKIYGFNGGKKFVTEEHPFMTTTGWKSINPDKTRKENIGISVSQLEVGDVLVLENGFKTIESIESGNISESTPLYNFMLSGDRTYYADGYLVHNKAQCADPGAGNCINSSVSPHRFDLENGSVLPIMCSNIGEIYEQYGSPQRITGCGIFNYTYLGCYSLVKGVGIKACGSNQPK